MLGSELIAIVDGLPFGNLIDLGRWLLCSGRISLRLAWSLVTCDEVFLAVHSFHSLISKS